VGFDPARFWEITPRLFAAEMEGAVRRARIERSHIWWGAMLPHLETPMSLERFVDPPKTKDRQSPEELQAMCTALAVAWGAEEVSHGN
jgi:hypothetical protein